MDENHDPNQETIRALDWERFLDLARSEARTDPGKALIASLLDGSAWASEPSSARAMQAETQESVPLLDRDALWGPLTELSDPSDVLNRLERAAVLETAELALLMRWLYAMDSWVQTPREEIRGERFKRALISVMEPFEPLRVLERVLTPTGELSEKASPRLASLHSEIRAIKKDILATLDQLMKGYAQKEVLQEAFTDVRDGRYVIPVKISAQGEIDGIIHEASASGQTVFIEPREVGMLNNRLRQKENDLIQEIRAILEDSSKRLRPFATEMSASVATLSHWDAVQAKARIGRRYSGKPISVSEERRFLLQQTAHPLLWWSLPPAEIVRNDVDFGEPVRTLLLTGPNTGGKTVLLKTLGLAGLCARTGFPFPGTDHLVVPFFDSFFVDVGDPQSIEQQLSSFSGHVLRYKRILERITGQSLVLIDELNSATDPEEGAAIGRAVLETAMGRGALIVTTTHDPHLKALAVSDTRILNASMAFDEGTRAPTYRMALGVPGRSRALETAQRLGLSEEVLTLARSYLSTEHNEFERMLSKLETDAHETARARKEAVALRDEAEKLKKEWTERTEASVGELLERTRQKLRRILEQAQDEVRAKVRKLDELKGRRETDQARISLNETFAQAAGGIEAALHEEAPDLAKTLARKEAAANQAGEAAQKLEPGMPVRIPKWKSTGTLLEVAGNKVKVAMGTLQMSLSISEVEPLPATAKPQGTRARVQAPETHTPPTELDIRGVRFEEGMSMVESYLDHAFRSGNLAEVTIIHGLGTGALREGTRKICGKLPYVKDYHDGGVGRGGTGATIVEFDRG